MEFCVEDPEPAAPDAAPLATPRAESAESAAHQLELAVRAGRGDERAFAGLVERFGQPVLSICYASTLNRGDAEDLAQDVFLAAWRALPRFRGESAFSTWLFALTRNRCIDKARRRAVRPQLSDAPISADEAWVAPDPSTQETVGAIMDVAARLPLPLRQALLLRDLQGLTYEEIAELQDVPVGTVRSRIASARSTVANQVSR